MYGAPSVYIFGTRRHRARFSIIANGYKQDIYEIKQINIPVSSAFSLPVSALLPSCVPNPRTCGIKRIHTSHSANQPERGKRTGDGQHPRTSSTTVALDPCSVQLQRRTTYDTGARPGERAPTFAGGPSLEVRGGSRACKIRSGRAVAA